MEDEDDEEDLDEEEEDDDPNNFDEADYEDRDQNNGEEVDDDEEDVDSSNAQYNDYESEDLSSSGYQTSNNGDGSNCAPYSYQDDKNFNGGNGGAQAMDSLVYYHQMYHLCQPLY